MVPAPDESSIINYRERPLVVFSYVLNCSFVFENI